MKKSPELRAENSHFWSWSHNPDRPVRLQEAIAYFRKSKETPPIQSLAACISNIIEELVSKPHSSDETSYAVATVIYVVICMRPRTGMPKPPRIIEQNPSAAIDSSSEDLWDRTLPLQAICCIGALILTLSEGDERMLMFYALSALILRRINVLDSSNLLEEAISALGRMIVWSNQLRSSADPSSEADPVDRTFGLKFLEASCSAALAHYYRHHGQNDRSMEHFVNAVDMFDSEAALLGLLPGDSLRGDDLLPSGIVQNITTGVIDAPLKVESSAEIIDALQHFKSVLENIK